MQSRNQRIAEVLAALERTIDALDLGYIDGHRIGYVVVLSEIGSSTAPPEPGLGAAMSNIRPALAIEILDWQIEEIKAELARELEAGPTH